MWLFRYNTMCNCWYIYKDGQLWYPAGVDMLDECFRLAKIHPMVDDNYEIEGM